LIVQFISWLIRYGHVLAATTWVGGYVLLAFFIIPRIQKGEKNEALVNLTIAIVRVLTYTGTLTMGFGLVLITRTRGFANLFTSTWGALIITGFVIALVLLGIGDGALRPALRKIELVGNGPARRWAIIGAALTVLAVGIMTGATYVL
jgi:putative copper export protein